MKAMNIYCSPYSILIISDKTIKRLKCPFKVTAVKGHLENIIKDKEYLVERVDRGVHIPLIYTINGKKYAYNIFMIL